MHRLYPEVPVVLVATQIDLRNEKAMLRELQEADVEPITPLNGLGLSEEIGAIKLSEVSAFIRSGSPS